jgi:hypothetical protein
MKKEKQTKKIDAMFDGHLEKPLSGMTPKEKIQYLWMQMEFKYSIRNRTVKKRNRIKPVK